MRAGRLGLLLLLLHLPAIGQTTVRFVLLEPPDDVPPPGMLILDIELEVEPNHAWLTGTVNIHAVGGSRFIYADDPNQPVRNPGSENPYVCAVSAPLPRLGSERFDNGHAALIGQECPAPSLIPSFEETHLGVSWYDERLLPCWEREWRSGAVARIAIQLDPSEECSGETSCCYTVYEPGAPIDATPILIANCPDSIHPEFRHWGFAWGECLAPLGTMYGRSWTLARTPNADSCRFDLTGDRRIGIDDLTHVLSSFGTTQMDSEFNPLVDFDRDGQVGLQDLADFLAHWDSL
ncbi:MAG: hypothetical protein AMXMBFR47_43250 [Planctomycetota bacterium]